MAERDKNNDIGLAPSSDPRAAYEHDFYSWLMEQARFVREGRWTAIDRDNLAEEIESLGREQFNKLESALRVLLLHLLKWDFQSARRARSWELSIKEQRIVVERVLDMNPGLRPRIAEALAQAYKRARLAAARETELDEDTFPEACPYSFDEAMTRRHAR